MALSRRTFVIVTLALAAGAVLIAALGAAVIGLLVFTPHLD
jgi:diacylglycerol kinase